MIRLGRRRPRVNPEPLRYFVHVPKTAGSTLNEYLRGWSTNGYEHCESVIEQPQEWLRRFAEADWMSGHSAVDLVLDRAGRYPDRRMRLFTCVREPTAQMMSHYNWLIEIHHRGGRFYEDHPPKAKEISEFVRSQSQTPQHVIDALRRYPGVFCNVQARVVLGGPGNWAPAEMVERLGRYEAVATHQQVGALFQTMTGKPPPASLRTNTSAYHFDRAVFEHPAVRAFLREYNASDYGLWRVVTTSVGGGRPLVGRDGAGS